MRCDAYACASLRRRRQSIARANISSQLMHLCVAVRRRSGVRRGEERRGARSPLSRAEPSQKSRRSSVPLIPISFISHYVTTDWRRIGIGTASAQPRPELSIKCALFARICSPPLHLLRFSALFLFLLFLLLPSASFSRRRATARDCSCADCSAPRATRCRSTAASRRVISARRPSLRNSPLRILVSTSCTNLAILFLEFLILCL